MNKAYYVLFALLGVIAILGAIGWIVFATDDTSDDNTKVATSIFPIYDLTNNLATGTDIEVVNILPENTSPHTYDPTISDQQRLDGVDVSFIIGLEFDEWAKDASKQANEDVRIVDLSTVVELIEGDDHADEEHHDEGEDEHEEHEHTSEHSEGESDDAHDDEHSDNKDHDVDHNDEEHDHEHGEYDPHYWLSVDNAIVIIAEIRDELIELDNTNESVINENHDVLVSQLQELKERNEQKVATLQSREIITFHSAFGYLADELQIEIVATVEEFPGQTPSPRYIAEVGEVIEEYNVRTLFKEPQLSDEIVSALANDYNAEVKTLDPIGGIEGRDSYIELIEYNVDTIVATLNE